MAPKAKEPVKEEVEEVVEKGPPVFELPKRAGGAGGAPRLDAADAVLRGKSLLLFESKKAKDILGYMKKYDDDEVALIDAGKDKKKRTQKQNYKKMLRSASQSLLADIEMFGTKKSEAHQKRLNHLDKSHKWFLQMEKPISLGMKKQQSMPNLLDFRREENPEPGSLRPFHPSRMLLLAPTKKPDLSGKLFEDGKMVITNPLY